MGGDASPYGDPLASLDSMGPPEVTTVAPERQYHWRALSPRSKAILAWIAVPVAEGLKHREIADRFNLRRPEIPDLPLPKVVSESWIGARMRELRAELIALDKSLA